MDNIALPSSYEAYRKQVRPIRLAFSITNTVPPIFFVCVFRMYSSMTTADSSSGHLTGLFSVLENLTPVGFF
jgi:hypothetical protein